MNALVFLLACAGRPAGPAPDAGGSPERVVIAHTNDLHAHFRGARAKWIDGEPDIGGMIELDKALRSFRAGPDPVLHLDGGDLLTGTPLMDVAVDGARGGAMIEFLDLLDTSAWALGNHEFDLGFENADALTALADSRGIPSLSANVRNAAGDDVALTGQLENTVVEVDGLSIGVFGLTTPELPTLVSPATLQRLTVLNMADAARDQVETLSDADLIVAVTHMGVDADRALAEEVPGIDLIVGGHSHTSLREAVVVGGTTIVQAGSYGRQVGEVTMTRTREGWVASSALHDLVPGAFDGEASPALVSMVEEHDAAISERFGAVVGEVEGNLGRDYHNESALGRWAADMMRAAAGAQIGLYNAGGLRADLVAGELTRGELYQVFPFSNQLVVFEATGLELQLMVDEHYTAMVTESRGVLQFSGLTATADLVGEGAGFTEPSIAVAGAGLDLSARWGLDLDARYTIATNSYVADQWEKYLGFRPQNLEVREETVFMVAEKAVQEGPVRDPADPRVVLNR